MPESLQEVSSSRGLSLRIDRQAGIIRGVKILGTESQNGRSYLPAALAAAAPLYEGAKVNVNHPRTAPGAPRDYQDRIGAIHNVVARQNEGLFADFHFNPQHALAGQLAWDAEHAPENVGFSHNVLAKTARRGERLVVEGILKVQSVDLVADPATTRGLFEAAGDNADSPPAGEADSLPDRFWDALTAAELERHRPDLVDSLRAPLQQELDELRRELDGRRTAEAVGRKRALAERLLTEARLPLPRDAGEWGAEIVSAAFYESLLAAPEEEMRRLVQERARLVAAAAGLSRRHTTLAGRPQAREQRLADALLGTGDGSAALARAITQP